MKHITRTQFTLLFLFLICCAGGLAIFFVSNPHTTQPCEVGAGDRQRCFAERIEDILDTQGLDAAFDALIIFSKADTNFATACHGNVHRIGEVAYKRYSNGEKILYTPKMSYCGYGFFHGFAEALVGETGSVTKAIEFCRSLDANLHGEALGGTTACFHGIGHGAVDGADPRDWGDPAKMVHPGLLLCGEMPDTNYAKYVCEAGAYNSLEILSLDKQYHLDGLISDPFAFCNKELRERQEACYTNMIPAVLRLTHDDLLAAAQYALKRIAHPDDRTVDDYRVDEMVVSSIFHEHIRINLGSTERIRAGIADCHTFESDHVRLACISGLSGGHMKYDTPESAYANWSAFCGSKEMRVDESDICYAHVLTRIRLWYGESRAAAICNEIPTTYQHYCSGASLSPRENATL